MAETLAFQKLQHLLQSGTRTNIDLAFELAKGEGISAEALVSPWQSVLQGCFASDEAEELRLQMHYIFEEKEFSWSGESTELPDALRYLRQVEELNLSHNNLIALPEWLGELAELRILEVYNNPLKRFPQNLQGFEKLHTVFAFDTALSGSEKDRIQAALAETSFYFRGFYH